MYSKLAFRNVKKSFRDYAIYFLTLMFGVCIFYVFNSIDSQQSMMVITESTAQSMETLQMLMSYFSVFVAVVLGFLIVYANRFLIRRRKKELGIYQTLGMEKGQIARILSIETLLIAILSLAVGLALGVLISQVFAVLTASLFQVKLAQFTFVFSSAAAIKAIVYFGIAFLFVLVFNRITIGKQKLIDLLYAERKNEKFKTPHLALSVILFVVSLVCLGVAYFLVLKKPTAGFQAKDEEIVVAIILGVIGTFLFFFSLSGFFLKVTQQLRGVYFKGLNMFVLRQINSKINTAYVSITLVCLMLFLAICGLSFGMGFSQSLTADMEWLHPFDVSFNVYMHTNYVNAQTGEIVDFDTELDVDLIEGLGRVGTPVDAYAKSVTQVKIYEGLVDPAANEGYMNGEYMTLSNYNKLLEMQGKPPATLAENEFIFNCLNEKHRNDYIEYFKQNTVYLQNTSLTLKNVDDTVLHNTSTVSNYNCIHILPDKLLENANSFMSVLAIDYNGQTHEYRALRQKATNEMFEKLQTEENNLVAVAIAYDRITDFEESKSSSVTIAYLAVYLGVIFAVMAAVVLAIAQLSEANDNAQRYSLLRKLGADGKMISRALFRQIAIYFGVPLLLAIIHSVAGISFANMLISQLGKTSILRDSLITAGILIVVYGGYFLATYFGSKRIVGDK